MGVLGRAGRCGFYKALLGEENIMKNVVLKHVLKNLKKRSLAKNCKTNELSAASVQPLTNVETCIDNILTSCVVAKESL